MARRTKGEGSLYQTQDGKWVFQFQLDGKRKTKRFQHKTDARAFQQALTAQVSTAPFISGQQSASQIITVGEWMTRWLELYAKPTVKLSTYGSYEQYIRGHIIPQIGGLYLNTLGQQDMQEFFNERGKHGHQKGQGGLSPKTLTNLRNMMHLAFDQAVKNGLISHNPIDGVRLPKAHRAEMRVLSRQEQERLILAAQQAPEPAAFGILFDLFTGLRIGELCALRWRDVDMHNRCFRVCATRNRLTNYDDTIQASTSVTTAESPKTSNSRRVVYLPDGLFQDLVRYKEIQDSIKAQYPDYDPEGYVFCQENGTPYEPRTYQDLFQRCVRRAGIAPANFHSLRHTFATRSLEQGMDMVTLSRLLGHASPSITLDKYGHALSEHQRSSVAKLDALYPDTHHLPAQPREDAGFTMGMGMGF